MPARMADLAPAVVVVAVGVASVILAMNILVTAPPIGISYSVQPSGNAAPTFEPTPGPLPQFTPEDTNTPAPVASLTGHQPRFVHSTIKASDPHGVWSVDFEYPAFVDGETPWAKQIDTDIRSDINSRAQQWEVGPAATRWAKGRKNTLTGTFVTNMVSPEIASWTLMWDDNSSSSGVVHGLETLNYDLSTGQRMTLDDIFIDATSAITLVSGAAPVMLQNNLGSAYDPALAIEGTSPLLSNYDHWGLTRTGLKVTFNAHQVSNRGPLQPSIVVPWNLLASVMNNTGPVAKMAGLAS